MPSLQRVDDLLAAVEDVLREVAVHVPGDRLHLAIAERHRAEVARLVAARAATDVLALVLGAVVVEIAMDVGAGRRELGRVAGELARSCDFSKTFQRAM